MKMKKKKDEYEVIITNPEAIPSVSKKLARITARLYMEGKIKIPKQEK